MPTTMLIFSTRFEVVWSAAQSLAGSAACRRFPRFWGGLDDMPQTKRAPKRPLANHRISSRSGRNNLEPARQQPLPQFRCVVKIPLIIAFLIRDR
jgi:hypothetical protein